MPDATPPRPATLITARPAPGLTRRRWLARAAAGAATLGAGVPLLRAQDWRGRDPFSLGVASGYPTPGGFVLWTRLAPDPVAGGGMGDAPVDVHWEVAADEGFSRAVAQGVFRAEAADAHSVHVEVTGLPAGRPYWYRFTAAGARSPAGATHTAPAADARTPIRLAFGSCQQYEQGFFSAYRDMVAQSPDLMVHLGDYIYEGSWGARLVRRHEAGVPRQLDEFRNRYALYKSDTDLRAAHAAFPWLVIWDDHEVVNDYTNDVAPTVADPEQLLARRAAAYKAWWEHMPAPAAMRPRGPNARIHARYRFGHTLDLLLLDGRQYRSRHACVGGRSASPPTDCAERVDPARSYLGLAQEAWLDAELAQPATQWTVLAQPTLMAECNRGGQQPAWWMDGWDGYAPARTRLLDSLAARRPRNALVIGGDVHAFWATDLRRTPESPVVATEFVGGSITSQGPNAQAVARLRNNNPHLRWGRGDRRGYALMTLDTRGCAVEFRAVDDEKRADSGAATLARFSVADGQAGVRIES